jgi:hypothetical protein
MESDEIRALVQRLARPDPRSGGHVIERAAIMAEGGDSAEILAWIEAHDGQPEEIAAATPRGGLHNDRLNDGHRRAAAVPQRYLLPAGTVS